MEATAVGAATVRARPEEGRGAVEEDRKERPRWSELGSDELSGRGHGVPRGFLPHRIIHFTFDDGPRLETTPRLLDALDEHRVRATFFVTGRQLTGPRGAERRALLQRIEEAGHTVAMHTHSHRDLRRMSAEQIERDLGRAEEALLATLGYRPGLFRPPYGGRGAASNRVVRGRGYSQVLWNISPEAPRAGSSESIVRSFGAALDRQERHRRGPGGIVLLHDPNPAAVDAFPLLVAEVRRRNCQLLERPGEELWDVAEDLRFHLFDEMGIVEDVLAARQRAARSVALDYCARREAAPEVAGAVD